MQARYSTQTCDVYVYQSERKTGEMRTLSLGNDITYQESARVSFINNPRLSMVSRVDFKERNMRELGADLPIPFSHRDRKLGNRTKTKVKHNTIVSFRGFPCLRPTSHTTIMPR